MLGLRSSPPEPFGPGTPEESERDRETVPWTGTPGVQKECALVSQESPERVQALTFGGPGRPCVGKGQSQV